MIDLVKKNRENMGGCREHDGGGDGSKARERACMHENIQNREKGV